MQKIEKRYTESELLGMLNEVILEKAQTPFNSEMYWKLELAKQCLLIKIGLLKKCCLN